MSLVFLVQFQSIKNAKHFGTIAGEAIKVQKYNQH